MKNLAAEKLTTKQQYWLDHLKKAKGGNIPLSEYAKANDLKLNALYNWHWILKSKGAIDRSETKPFVRVVQSTARSIGQNPLVSNVQIRFANQTQVELQLTSVEIPQLLSWVKSL